MREHKWKPYDMNITITALRTQKKERKQTQKSKKKMIHSNDWSKVVVGNLLSFGKKNCNNKCQPDAAE